MHRSGTSLVAGLLDRLGLDGGPRGSMVAADEFNSDGYWEQRPIVEWHNGLLARLKGWPSAPPEAPDGHTWDALAGEVGGQLTTSLASLYQTPWFVKDPRQCLVLGLWSKVRGAGELAVVVSRSPRQVIWSLQRRNGYSARLAAALWERYNHDLLLGLRGRPCLFVRYEEVTAEPAAAVASLADALGRHLGPGYGDHQRLADAVALVRPARSSPSPAAELNAGQLHLDRLLLALAGYHPCFSAPEDLPALSHATAGTIARRRAWLNLLRPVAEIPSDIRERLDRLPSRHRFRRTPGPRTRT